MRVLLVNTHERAGGAAVATRRLLEALNNNGVKAKMLVANKETDNINVVGLPHPWRHRMAFLWERLCIFLHLRFSKKHLFGLDIANLGVDITSLPEFQQADIIHLAWINQGMLSLKGIRNILKSGKPVVWTMHDLWPVSGICHLSLGCERFKSGCSHCPYLPKGGGERDLSYRVWQEKNRLYEAENISFVACSRWLADEARASCLTRDHVVTTIPNPLNTSIFCKKDKALARKSLHLPLDRRLIAFIAQKVTNENKGMNYLIEACDRLVSMYPKMKQSTGIVIIGGHAEEFEQQLAMPVYSLGYIRDEKKMAEVYRSIDVFVLPSLSENLPNTIMEAMACGVPCVGFNIGGIPEMIDHCTNGYVANYRDAGDLAKGIHWILEETAYDELGRQAIHKVVSHYSQQAVAAKYIEVYNQATALK
ncbi:glycosyltransferase, group 1 family protein [Hallella bergensis DSM 17361]|uniref:Glycosyltransferase, group 1 family protein n=1 Tax=Hallella bergensis DSM 17361 TaxID=585502 RepID=D1PU87_9BACT|nr:glycosyltransferase family 4 protein [Hallella bergensis]EFA45085.1 glycosyltransferase, group 1 family protein [Hallella bergensis DSM 17361]